MNTIEVPALARVEGEGGLYIRLQDGQAVEVRLDIYEPPRFFEGLPGRALPAGCSRYHRPHLRHLPGGLPNELGDRPGESPRGRK